jgi:hypothetical protein
VISEVFRRKTNQELAKEFELRAYKDGLAKDYDEITRHISDNAYLYYIHHRLGFANKYLEEIRNTLYVIAAIAAFAVAKYVGLLP